MTIATSVGLILSEDSPQRKYHWKRRRRSGRAFAMVLIWTTLIAIALMLASCSASGRVHRQSTTTLTPLYQSPVGGSNVYRVDGPQGTRTITVTPGYRSPIDGSTTYHITTQP